MIFLSLSLLLIFGINPNGYTKKHNQYTDTRNAHLLGEEYTIRRRGKLRMTLAPQTFTDYHKSNKQHKLNLMSQGDPSDQDTNGDKLTIDEQCPNHKKTGRIRVVFSNTNGISSRQNNMTMEYFLQQCVGVQADVIGAVEIIQPLSTPTVCEDLRTCIKHFDCHAKLQFGYIDGNTTHKGFQMGGQAMIAQSGISHLIKTSGKDNCGRWTWMSLGDIQLHLIIAYRVQPGTDGHNTIRAQEFRYLLRTNINKQKTLVRLSTVI